jgi:hypothetical protein
MAQAQEGLGVGCVRVFGLRVPVVLTIAAATAALLFAGQGLYLARSVAVPVARAVRAVPGVASASVQTTGAGLVVTATLELVPNLRETYLAVADAAASRAGGLPVTVRIRDRRTPALVRAYYALDPVLQQGRVTGQFVAMEQALAQGARRLGLSRADAVVGVRRLYVTLAAGSHYLYDILPLGPGPATGA